MCPRHHPLRSRRPRLRRGRATGYNDRPNLECPRAWRPWDDECPLHHIKVFNLDFVFLSETRFSKHRVEIIRFLLGFRCCFLVDRVGMSGGLDLFWKEDTYIQIGSFFRFHIDASCLDVSEIGWRFMGIYRNPKASQRRFMWELLRRVHGNSFGSWLCGGDFVKSPTILRSMVGALMNRV